MWKAIISLISFFGPILMRIFRKRDKLKPASEILPEESPTEKAAAEAERKAEAKFGPRLAGRPHQPVKRVSAPTPKA